MKDTFFQVSYFFIISVSLLFISLSYILLTTFNQFLLLFFLLLISILITFCYVKIEVKGGLLERRIGLLGYPRHRLILQNIEYLKEVDNAWKRGWIIRFIPKSKLYSISHPKLLKIITKNGKSYILKTDRPKQLKGLLENNNK